MEIRIDSSIMVTHLGEFWEVSESGDDVVLLRDVNRAVIVPLQVHAAPTLERTFAIEDRICSGVTSLKQIVPSFFRGEDGIVIDIG